MKITPLLTDETLLNLIGERLTALRLNRNLTQKQVAEEAGIGVRTLQRLEQGESATQLSGFIRVCRVLGLVENLELLLPEPPVSPMELLKLQRQQRKRASGRKTPVVKEKKWTWGDSK